MTNEIFNMDDILGFVNRFAHSFINGAVTDEFSRTARRFILAYGEPVDYSPEEDYYNLSMNFYWKTMKYTVKVNNDGSIVFLDDAKVEIPLDTVSDSGWFARVNSALKEAASVAPQTVKKDGMREVKFPTLTAFHPDMQRADKAQVVKVLEETAELSVAVNDYRKGEGSRNHMADELADVLQTLANLVDAYQLTDKEIAEAVDRVKAHNKERGRYQPGERRMFS